MIRQSGAQRVRPTVVPLRASAVPESMAKQFPNRPIIVDPTKAPDQFGLRLEQIKQLPKYVIPESLKVGK